MLQHLSAQAVNWHVAFSVVVLQVKYQMLAAASFLAEVVKVLERVTSQAAATASAEPDEDMVSILGWHLVCVQPAPGLNEIQRWSEQCNVIAGHTAHEPCG